MSTIKSRIITAVICFAMIITASIIPQTAVYAAEDDIAGEYGEGKVYECDYGNQSWYNQWIYPNDVLKTSPVTKGEGTKLVSHIDKLNIVNAIEGEGPAYYKGKGSQTYNSVFSGDVKHEYYEISVSKYQLKQGYYDVTYDLDGGKFESAAPSKIYIGTTVELPKATKKGYKLQYWTKDNSDYSIESKTNDNDERVYSLKTPRLGNNINSWGQGIYSIEAYINQFDYDVVLTANWERAMHVKYYFPGARMYSRDDFFEEDMDPSQKNLSRYNPVKEGATFVGWYEDSAFKKEVTTFPDDVNIEELSLYAKFVDNNGNDGNDPNDGTGDDNDGEHQHNFESKVKKATFTKNGSIQLICTSCGADGGTTVIPGIKTVELSAVKYTYSGKNIKPSVKVKDIKGKEIISDNYTVTYPEKTKNVGKYTVSIKFKGNYSGSKNLTFTINPPKTSLGTLTAKSKAFTVKWSKKTTQVTGYQIQYSTSSSFKSGNASVNVTSAKTVSKTVKDLKAKKKYYVRIRTYKTVNKVKYYSDWSKSKSITTK